MYATSLGTPIFSNIFSASTREWYWFNSIIKLPYYIEVFFKLQLYELSPSKAFFTAS